MMGRKAAIEFYGYSYLVSVEEAGVSDGIEPDDIETSGWFPHFPHYKEDAQGRLLYFWQPMTGSLAGLRNDLAWIRAHPRPHFAEVFDRVDVVDTRDLPERRTVKTLHDVTLLEAMDGLVEALKVRDAARKT
jgi:hypothetical protein